MNRDLVKDILLKAAEDVQQGMWCQGTWFANGRRDDGSAGVMSLSRVGGNYEIDEVTAYQEYSTEELATKYRCAEGSLVLATRLLGGTPEDYQQAVALAASNAKTPNLYDFNDALDGDLFENGQRVAELFRTTAEKL